MHLIPVKKELVTQSLCYSDDNESYVDKRGEYSEVIITFSELEKVIKIKGEIKIYIKYNDESLCFIIEAIGSKTKAKVIFSGKKVSVKF